MLFPSVPFAGDVTDSRSMESSDSYILKAFIGSVDPFEGLLLIGTLENAGPGIFFLHLVFEMFFVLAMSKVVELLVH